MTVLLSLEDAPEHFAEGLLFRRYDSRFDGGPTHQGGIKRGTGPISPAFIEHLRVSPPDHARVVYEDDPPAAA